MKTNRLVAVVAIERNRNKVYASIRPVSYIISYSQGTKLGGTQYMYVLLSGLAAIRLVASSKGDMRYDAA